MRIARYSLFLMVMLAMAVPAGAADEQDSAALAAVLQSDAPKADKALTCKRLAVWGTEDTVPALAPLLEDPELASWARIALEAIPGPAADKALRDAMGKVDGRLLIGVVNSIAVREDAEAVEGLTKLLKSEDADVASAAAAALGRIGNAEACKTLEAALGNTPEAVQSAVAEGCVYCAERLMADGKMDEAAKLYDTVRQAKVPKQRIVEATRGAILARGADGVPLLFEQLQSDDLKLGEIALMAARELTGEGATEAMVANLPRLPADRQPFLILALADRGDPAVLPAMLTVVKDGPDSVRVAALAAVKRMGDASCVPVLLQVAAAGDAEASSAARKALEELPGDGVNEAIASRLEGAKGAEREVLIDLVGRRRIPAVAALIKAAGDSDDAIRAAALTALGETVDLEHVAVLIERVIAPKKNADREPAAKALRAACVRMPEREECAKQLVDAMSKAAAADKITLLQTLGAMEGPTALKAVGDAAKGSDEQLKDVASQLLGKWMTVEAAPVLLELAKSDIGKKYEIRALRGYIRIVRQFQVPEKDRAEMCRQALTAAQRDDEKKLVLEVLQRYPSIGTMQVAVELAKTKSLADDAKAAALVIAQQIGGSADIAKLLVQVGQKPVKIEILKATYGAGDKQKDVTAIVAKRAGSLPLIVLPSSTYNSAFGGDPASGIVKQLKIQYRMDGKPGEASFKENATILLPTPK